jgi:hypothetical protein
MMAEGDLQVAKELAEELGISTNGVQPDASKAARLLALARDSGASFFRDMDSGDFYMAPDGDGT